MMKLWIFIYAYAWMIFGDGNGTPLQSSCLENPMNGVTWWATVHGVTKSQTQLSDFTFIFHFHALEREMATHSSVLAWRTPGMGEPDGLPSMGSHRVGHDWSDLAAAASQQQARFLWTCSLLPWWSRVSSPVHWHLMHLTTSDQRTHFMDKEGRQWTCGQDIHWPYHILNHPEIAA